MKHTYFFISGKFLFHKTILWENTPSQCFRFTVQLELFNCLSVESKLRSYKQRGLRKTLWKGLCGRIFTLGPKALRSERGAASSFPFKIGTEISRAVFFPTSFFLSTSDCHSVSPPLHIVTILLPGGELIHDYS